MDKQYVLEWSKSSNGFHIQKVEHLLNSNMKSFADNRSHDYLALMFGSKDDCCAAAEKFRAITISRVVPMLTRQQTIELIQKMNQFNQREQAMRTYKLANETWPEWELKAAFEALKGQK